MKAPDPNTPVRVVHSFLDGLPSEKHIPDTKPGDITYTNRLPPARFVSTRVLFFVFVMTGALYALGSIALYKALV